MVCWSEDVLVWERELNEVKDTLVSILDKDMDEESKSLIVTYQSSDEMWPAA